MSTLFGLFPSTVDQEEHPHAVCPWGRCGAGGSTPQSWLTLTMTWHDSTLAAGLRFDPAEAEGGAVLTGCNIQGVNILSHCATD